MQYTTRQANEFKRHFGVSLRDYWSNLLGLDITRFDDEVIKSGNQSMRTAIFQSKGTDAVRIVTELLEIR